MAIRKEQNGHIMLTSGLSAVGSKELAGKSHHKSIRFLLNLGCQWDDILYLAGLISKYISANYAECNVYINYILTVLF